MPNELQGFIGPFFIKTKKYLISCCSIGDISLYRFEWTMTMIILIRINLSCHYQIIIPFLSNLL